MEGGGAASVSTARRHYPEVVCTQIIKYRAQRCTNDARTIDISVDREKGLGEE